MGRGDYEWLTATSQLCLLNVCLNHRCSLLGAGVSWWEGSSEVLCFVLVLAWIFSPSLLSSFIFSFLTPRYIRFVSPLSSALDSERSLDMLEAKAQQGDTC